MKRKSIRMSFAALTAAVLLMQPSAASVSAAYYSDVVVTIDQIEISISELEACDYIVPVSIRCETQVPISSYAFGAVVDDRCYVSVDSKASTLKSLVPTWADNIEGFFWFTAASGYSTYLDGTVLTLNVHVPEDAAIGDWYDIRYADTTLRDEPHLWSDVTDRNHIDYVAMDAVEYYDGGIHIVEDTCIPGDVTEDGVINANDASILLIATAEIGAGNASGLTELQEQACDVNKDQIIDASDAGVILRYAAEIGVGKKDIAIEDFI